MTDDRRLIEDLLPAEAPAQAGIVAARFYEIPAEAAQQAGNRHHRALGHRHTEYHRLVQRKRQSSAEVV